MPNKSSRRRSYGYVPEHEKKRPSRPAPAPRSPEKKTPTKEQAPSVLIRAVVFLLFLPFRLLWSAITLLWKSWRNRPRNQQDRRALAGFLFKWGSIAAAGGAVLLIIAFVWVSKDLPDPDKLTDRQVAQSTKIYDRTGEVLLYEIFAEQKRTLIPFEQIPEELKEAVIATEDTTFYEHWGLRPLSILRAIAFGVFTDKRIAGTSTLTQQLVKNAILTNERTITRKVKEAILSVRLEQKYDKDQILQIYFNEIPYGSTNYGVQAAAQSYFGKDVSALTLQEIATLAGLPKAPSRYLNDPEALKQRRDFVLKRMHDEGKITLEEKEAAQAEPVTLDRQVSNIKAPHFVFDVRQQLIEAYGEQLVDTGGLKVVTTLDWEKQQVADTVVEEIGTGVLEEAEANNTALVSMDPNTGHILAMIGSKDFDDEEINGWYNVATLGERQPGSSFKPIVYTAAFEKGYTPETVLFDVETDFARSGESYKPLNYDLQEHGPVTIEQALQGSLNIPAVKALYLVGDKKGVEFAERLGYSTLSSGDFGLSLVLGGGEVKLVDHVAAYSVFANGGDKVSPVSILKVEDANGDILQEWKAERAEKILDPKVAATISSVLSNDDARAYAFGAGGVLTLPERPVAAKTGTTNGYIDAWTVGYTPSLVTGVWAGNTDNTPMKRGFGGSKVAGPIWQNYMKGALEGSPVESFPERPENDAEKPALRGSQGGGITLKVDRVTGKLATSSTPERYIVERTYTQAHSILHYVKKDDPRGEVPKDPSNDQQYDIWEQSINDWIVRKQEEDPDWEIVFEEPPTEYDDIHSLALIPSLEVIYPAPSSTIFSRQIDTDIRVSAPRGVTRVSYKLDGKGVALVREHPFNLNYTATRLTPGVHTLTVIVQDDVGNTLEEDVIFTFDPKNEPAAGYWDTGNQTVTTGDFPRDYSFTTVKANDIDRIVVEHTINGNTQTLATFDEPLADHSFSWVDPPEKGRHTLSILVEQNGTRRTTDTISVTVQ